MRTTSRLRECGEGSQHGGPSPNETRCFRSLGVKPTHGLSPVPAAQSQRPTAIAVHSASRREFAKWCVSRARIRQRDTQTKTASVSAVISGGRHRARRSRWHQEAAGGPPSALGRNIVQAWGTEFGMSVPSRRPCFANAAGLDIRPPGSGSPRTPLSGSNGATLGPPCRLRGRPPDTRVAVVALGSQVPLVPGHAFRRAPDR